MPFLRDGFTEGALDADEAEDEDEEESESESESELDEEDESEVSDSVLESEEDSDSGSDTCRFDWDVEGMGVGGALELRRVSSVFVRFFTGLPTSIRLVENKEEECILKWVPVGGALRLCWRDATVFLMLQERATMRAVMG